MRNRNWLKPEYFECLARHQVAHVSTRWDAMPPVGEQMALPGSRTNPDLVAARFLLKPGRKYEQAVKAFEPYDSIKEENPEARAAGRALIAEGQAAGPKQQDVYLRQQPAGRERDFYNRGDDSACLKPKVRRLIVSRRRATRGQLVGSVQSKEVAEVNALNFAPAELVKNQVGAHAWSL